MDYSDKTILLVEDEPIIAMSETALLQRYGFSVLSAGGARAAIDAVTDNSVDLILMDIDLGTGKMDGTEAAEIILREHDIPVVFLSSHTEQDIVEKTEKISSYGYVVKNSGDTVLLTSIKMAFRLYEEKQRAQKNYQELQKREKALQESEDFLVKTGEMARVGGWEIDLDGGTVYWTKVTKEIHEVPPDYTPTLDEALKFYPDDSGERIDEAVRRIMESEGNYSLDLDFITARGNELKVRAMGHSVFNDGKCVRLYGTFQDISTISELTQFRINQEKRQQILIDLHRNINVSPDGLYDSLLDASIDITGSTYSFFGFIEEEQSSMKIYAWSQEAMEDCSVQDEFVHFPLQHAGIWADCIREKRPVIYNDYNSSIPSSYGLPEGHVPIRRILGFPLMDDDEVVAVCVVANKEEHYNSFDIESLSFLYEHILTVIRKREVEEEMQLQEALYRNLMENSIDAVYLLSEEGRVLNVNRAACIMTGYIESELLELTIDDIDINYPSRKFVDFWSDKPEGSTVLFESQHKRKDGTVFPVEVNGIFFILDGVKKLFGVARDMTAKKTQQDEIEKNLEEKEFLLKELNHRVKNNLMMISSLISLKNSTLGNKPDLSDIEHQIDAIQIVHEQLNQTEDFARVQIRDYINDLLFNIFSSPSEKMVTVDSIIDECTIQTRRAISIGLIVNEIATNTVKYALHENSNPKFIVRLDSKSPGSDVVLTLGNNGGPIPEDITMENPSTLGLRLISALVEQLGGTIHLQHTPHPRFTFTFPHLQDTQ